MMHVNRLSQAKIKHAKPGRHSDGGGLYLQITEGKGGTLHRSWIFAYSLPQVIVSRNGRPRQRSRAMGLGPVAVVSLAEAREKARQLWQQVKDGADPIEDRRTRRAQKLAESAKSIATAKTFEQTTHAFISAHSVKWRSQKHGVEWYRTLQRFVFPRLGRLPISQVDVPLVLEVLEPIWSTVPETAHRVMGRIASVVDYATAAGWRPVGPNPADWKTLRHLLPPVKKIKQTRHLAALSYNEVPELMAKLRESDSVVSLAIQLTILTACRTNEIRGALIREVGQDDETKLVTWNIPPERTKNGQGHRVPLGAAALDVLERAEQFQRNDFLFAGRIDSKDGRLGQNAMIQRLQDMGYKTTAHGFRSSFRDWAAEHGAVHEVAELCLGHKTSDKVVAAYLRTDMLRRRAALMEQWANYVTSPPSTGQVVEMKRSRA